MIRTKPKIPFSINIWRLFPFDLYCLAKPILFRMDPENAHNLSLKLLRKGFGPKDNKTDDPVLQTNVCGLDFPNPIGLAAGFDKQCEAMVELLRIGFGFIELGTVTPRPQPGNPRPRLFRATSAQAVINRFGFNSDGFDDCARHAAAWHSETTWDKKRGIVGVNVGNNKDKAGDISEYVAGYKTFAPYADYITVNISSPNTPGLRNMQGREQLAELLKQVMEARAACAKQPPVFVKIAPDQTEQQEEDIAEVVLTSGVHAMIIGNTTLSRPENLPPDFAKETGGLSGKPLFETSTKLLARMYKRTGGKIPLIGVGGISSGEDAYAKIRAGASLVQLYTALVFEGPKLIPRIKRDMAALLKRDGFNSVTEAVGVDHK